MDDVYGINVAKTEFRDAYGFGDVNRLMAVFNPKGFTDMSEGGPTKYGAEALSSFRDQTVNLFAVRAVPTNTSILPSRKRERMISRASTIVRQE